MTPKVLVIDDRERHIELFHALLREYEYLTRCELPGPCWDCPRRQGCSLTHAHDWGEAEQALTRHKHIDVVLLDMVFDLPPERLLGDEELETRKRRQGLHILNRLRQHRSHLPVVLMTSRQEIDREHADRLDADEFLTLAGADAFDARAMALLIERVLARQRSSAATGGYLWGSSARLRRVRQDASALARTSLPVLITGETGTGKSALAERVIHSESGRSGNFVAVDLSALPPTLVAAELFGTARGAFSGAQTRAGRFETADGGTLFLDEIGNLTPDVQRMLLLAVQTGQVTRLGENGSRRVDVKLVAATNADLRAAVRRNEFRADLYARLNPGARLELPPLRERADDIVMLSQSFVERQFQIARDQKLLVEYATAIGLSAVPRASLSIGETPVPEAGILFVLQQESLARLREHRWPGNLRELQLVTANAVLLSLADAMRAVESGRDQRSPLRVAQTIPISAKLIAELIDNSWLNPETDDGEATQTRVTPRPHLKDVARDLERDLFERLFRATDGDFEAMAARLLEGDPAKNARRVRLRFNQLGLRARSLSIVSRFKSTNNR